MRRVVWAIARRSFARGTRLKTQMSKATLWVCLFFIACFVLNVISAVFPFTVVSTQESSGIILLVNSPDSFETFLGQTFSGQPEIVQSAFIREESGAYYDFLTFQQKLSADQADLVIVFPKDFDGQMANLSGENRLQILTYYDPSDEASKSLRETAVNSLLTPYGDTLQKEYGRVSTSAPVFEVLQQELVQVQTADILSGTRRIISHMFLPLTLFIAIMYSCMEAGMASVAGEKERGTFAAILLTPARRSDIVLGNTLGILMHAMIPAVVMILFFTAVFGFFHIGTLLYLLILCLSLALLMSALVLIISILNRSILAAQASFLPIFFILLIVCITSMQNEVTPALLSFLLPFYGHYYGISAALDGTYSVGILCGLCGICIAVTTLLLLTANKLLHIERFTTSVDDNQDIRKENLRRDKDRIMLQRESMSPQNAVFGFHASKSRPAHRLLTHHFLLPLYILAPFQILALITPFLLYLRTDAAADFLTGLSRSDGSAAASASMVMGLLSSLMQTESFVFTMGVSYVLVIAVYVLIIRIIEKQPLSTAGLPFAGTAGRRKALLSYVRGLAVGFGMMLLVFLILLISGQIRMTGIGLSPAASGLFLIYILMWIPQGAAEEIMFRGYMLPHLSARFGRAAAVLLTSLSFSILHIGNTGFSPVAFLNLFLIAVFFALLALTTGDIWTVCAAHSIWNFAQGNLFGLEVSGTQSTARLMQTQYTPDSTSLLTGGDFGPEGGLIVTVVVVLCLLILLFIRHKLNRTILAGPKENIHADRIS